MPQVPLAPRRRDPYVYIVQVETLTEGSRHYSVIPEKPVTKLIGVHSTLRSANRAAKRYAKDDDDLPGGGERADYDLDEKIDRNGCYSCGIDLLEFAGDGEDIADAHVQVKRVLLEGPNLALGQVDSPTSDEDEDDDDEEEDEGEEDELVRRHRDGVRQALAMRDEMTRRMTEQHRRTQQPAARPQPAQGSAARPVIPPQQPVTEAYRPVAPAKRPLPAPADDDDIQFIKEVKRPRG